MPLGRSVGLTAAAFAAAHLSITSRPISPQIPLRLRDFTFRQVSFQLLFCLVGSTPLISQRPRRSRLAPARLMRRHFLSGHNSIRLSGTTRRSRPAARLLLALSFNLASGCRPPSPPPHWPIRDSDCTLSLLSLAERRGAEVVAAPSLSCLQLHHISPLITTSSSPAAPPPPPGAPPPPPPSPSMAASCFPCSSHHLYLLVHLLLLLLLHLLLLHPSLHWPLPPVAPHPLFLILPQPPPASSTSTFSLDSSFSSTFIFSFLHHTGNLSFSHLTF